MERSHGGCGLQFLSAWMSAAVGVPSAFADETEAVQEEPIIKILKLAEAAPLPT